MTADNLADALVWATVLFGCVIFAAFLWWRHVSITRCMASGGTEQACVMEFWNGPDLSGPKH